MQESDPQDGNEVPEWTSCPAGGITAALRSVANQNVRLGGALSPIPRLFSIPGMDRPHTQPAVSPDSTKATTDDTHSDSDQTEEEAQQDPPQVNFVYLPRMPLYQEYWLQCLRTDMSGASQGGLSDLVVSQCLPGLQSPSEPPLAAAPSPPPDSPGWPCTLWQELPEVRERGLLQTLTAHEARRQEAMFELIASEASYLRSVAITVQRFQESRELQRILPGVQHHVLFSNIKEVHRISARFLQDLESRLRESVVISQVGDIVLRHHSAFRRVYVPYVTNIMYQEALINQLLLENRTFTLTLRELEKDPECKRQSLKSFLVLPFQRITRLRLLLENILKRTDGDSFSIAPLLEAIEAVREIVFECDEKVQEMKQTEELVHLEKLMDFSHVKTIPLIVSGRHLIHKGPLRQLKMESSVVGPRLSFTDVYLHLFNDLLLLSQLRDQRFSVQHYAAFPTQVSVEGFNTQLLGLPPETFLLHLRLADTKAAIILNGCTWAETDTWLQVLSKEGL